MVLSCQPQKKSNSVEQEKNAENIETSEAYFDNNEQEETAGITKFDEGKDILYAKKENIDKALKVWKRAKEYPFYEDCVKKIIYGNGRFVAAGHLRIPLAYSDDGDTWYKVESDVLKPGIYGMAYGKGRFVAANYGDKMAYSDDGITWKSAKNGGLGDYYIQGISYGNGCFVAVGSFGRRTGGVTGIIGYSKDGEEWEIVEDGSLNINYFACISYGNGMFIAGAAKGNAAYSNDGKTWTAMPGSPFDDLDVNILVYGNGRFVAECSYFQGYSSTTFFSDNGFDWTVASEAPVDPVYNIFYANGIFISGSHSARMTYSIDGERWYPGSNGFIINALAGTGDSLGGIAYGKGRFVIGCGNGLKGSSGIAWCLNFMAVYDIPPQTERRKPLR